jgi:AraC-like DNA-binding protein
MHVTRRRPDVGVTGQPLDGVDPWSGPRALTPAFTESLPQLVHDENGFGRSGISRSRRRCPPSVGRGMVLPMHASRVTSVLALDDRASIAGHPVDERLVEHVRAYWTLDIDDPPARLRVIPDGQVDLVFDLDHAEALVSGAVPDPFEAVHERATHLLGATLVPGAAASVLGVKVGALQAGWQPLASVVGPSADVLGHKLKDASGLVERLALVETFLLARLGRTDGRVARALEAIDASDGGVTIADLGRRSGASGRNLSRLFHDWVGLSPKRFARIVRVQAALRRLAEPAPPDLASLADELGFADQAHLAREVRAVAGAAPSRLAETFKRKSDTSKR